MRITGYSNPYDFTGGIFQIDVKIKPDFKPDTQLALTWTQLASGNFVATDRGSASDRYEVDIEFYNTEATIDQLIVLLNSNREAVTSPSVVVLSNFNDSEHIFGDDLVYTGTITCNVMSISQRSQGSWKGFGLSMRLSAVSPSFISGTGALPKLDFLDIGSNADIIEYTVGHQMSYRNSNFFNPDYESDIGQFTGTFTFDVSEMAQLRSYIRHQRGSTISLPVISGVDYPFGPVRDSGYPYDAKIIKFQDLGYYSIGRRRCIITFAEVSTTTFIEI